MRRGLAIILVLALAFSVVMPLKGETGTVLKGYVLRPAGNIYKPIKGAVVEVENLATHQKLSSEPTDESGAYFIKGLIPGDYRIWVVVNNKKFEVQKKLTIDKNTGSFFASFVIREGKKWPLLLVGASAVGMLTYEFTVKEKEASPTK